MISFQVKQRDQERDANVVIEIVIDPKTKMLFFVDFNARESGKFKIEMSRGTSIEDISHEEYFTIVSRKRSTKKYKELTSSEITMITSAIKNRVLEECSMEDSEEDF